MTGGQKSQATGRLRQICEGIGVSPDRVIEIVPLRKNHDENVHIMREEFEYKGVSVIIAARECIQTATKRKKSVTTAK
jgi:indolepyruvate ferredoxin oxidoreductase alpha subunit